MSAGHDYGKSISTYAQHCDDDQWGSYDSEQVIVMHARAIKDFARKPKKRDPEPPFD